MDLLIPNATLNMSFIKGSEGETVKPLSVKTLIDSCSINCKTYVLCAVLHYNFVIEMLETVFNIILCFRWNEFKVGACKTNQKHTREYLKCVKL